MRPTGRRINIGRASRPHLRVEGGLSAYLDTSILLPTLIAEPMTEAVYDYLGAERLELLIRDFAAAEVASALSRLVRTALLTEADASARLADSMLGVRR
jgi:predicted nucleic acid-binding protein